MLSIHGPTGRLALLACALLLSAGCDSTDDAAVAPGGNACVSGSMTATADGSAFAAECVSFQINSGVLSVVGITNVDGSDGATQRQIQLTVPGASVGTASAPIGFTAVYSDAELSGGAQVSGTTTAGLSGSIELTALTDDRAAGTFSFSGSEFEISAGAGTPGSGTPTGRTVSVTGGTFDVEL